MSSASDGALLGVEEQASLETIPAAARAAIEKHAAGDHIATVEVVTRGSVVAYEAIVVKSSKKSEVTVNADGSPAK